MVLVGGAHSSGDKVWCRCTRCHHMTLLEQKIPVEADGDGGTTTATATPYHPENSFKVGEAIFHTEWNDFGKVLNKVRTSDGSHAIVVSFEKQGQRTLIENMKS
jgi:hypothetical protein